MIRRFTVLATVVFIVLVAASAGSSARQQERAAQPDVLSSLLVEVRALRVAMEHMASAGPRVQLAFGRLQLQEQRINSMLRRHETVREQLATAGGQEEELRSRVKRYEDFIRGNPKGDQREDLEKALPELLREAARSSASLQTLQNEESTLASQIAAEQGRWTEINRSLEELERSLARR